MPNWLAGERKSFSRLVIEGGDEIGVGGSGDDKKRFHSTDHGGACTRALINASEDSILDVQYVPSTAGAFTADLAADTQLAAYNSNDYRFYRGTSDITEQLRSLWKRTYGTTAAEASLGQPILSYNYASSKIHDLSVVKSGDGFMVGDLVQLPTVTGNPSVTVKVTQVTDDGMISRDGARATTFSHMCQVYDAALNAGTAADTVDAKSIAIDMKIRLQTNTVKETTLSSSFRAPRSACERNSGFLSFSVPVADTTKGDGEQDAHRRNHVFGQITLSSN